MTERFTGVNSMVGRLEKVAMRRPGAILSADAERWHYGRPVDPESLTRQYQTFVDLVTEAGAEVVWLPDDDEDDLADSIFVYDPSFTVPGGVIVARPGKALRDGEAELHRRFYLDSNIPIVGQIEAPGLFEGGDCFWLDDKTLAVGRGFRTNQCGIDQLSDIVGPLGIEVLAFDLPYHLGPEACLHLLSVVNPLDGDLALAHPPLMPTALWETMVEFGYEMLAVPPDEITSSSGLCLNVLATAPRQAIAIKGFPGTLALMTEAGCRVSTFAADALCLPCEGGPTCLTRPLIRS